MVQKFSNRKDLLVELVRTNFKLRYNNSVLGFIWVLLKPFLTFVILYFVFSRFKGGWVENYQIYLLLGMVLYTFVNEGVVFGMNSILDLSHIILKVNFPREIALTSSVIMAVINLGINLVVLFIFSIFNPISTSVVAILYFLLILIIMFVGIYGVTFFSSIIVVKLRDLEHITTLVMQLLFYATPIFYPLDLLPEYAQKLISLNPLTILIQSAREALIYGNVVNIQEILIVFLIVIVLLFLGNLYFKKNVRRIAEKF